MYYTVDNEIIRDYKGDIVTDADEAIEIVIDEYVTYEDYDQWLDEIDGVIEVLGTTYEASYVLKNLSPTDYRVGFSDFTEWLRSDASYNMMKHDTCYILGYEIEGIEEDEEADTVA